MAMVMAMSTYSVTQSVTGSNVRSLHKGTACIHMSLNGRNGNYDTNCNLCVSNYDTNCNLFGRHGLP